MVNKTINKKTPPATFYSSDVDSSGIHFKSNQKQERGDKMNIREYAFHLSDESKRLKKLYEFREELSRKILLGLKIKDVKKSYNSDETQLYIFIQTDIGSINITLDLMERVEL